MKEKEGSTCFNAMPRCGETPSGWAQKILIVVAWILVALSFNRADDSVSVFDNCSEQFEELQIKRELEAWFELMRETPVSRLVGKAGIDKEGGTRIFETCLADTVVVNQNTADLSSVTGHAIVEFLDDSVCVDSLGIATIEGVWDKGVVDGSVNITYIDGRYAEAVLRRGVIWGIVKTYRCLYGSCNIWEDELDDKLSVSEPKYLASLIEYKAGRPAPRPAWWLPVGGGAIFCWPDSEGLPHGEDCAYLYSDYNTVLVGEWVAGRMRGAVEGRVRNLSREGRILRPEIEKLKDRLDRVFSFDISTSKVISSDPVRIPMRRGQCMWHSLLLKMQVKDFSYKEMFY